MIAEKHKLFFSFFELRVLISAFMTQAMPHGALTKSPNLIGSHKPHCLYKNELCSVIMDYNRAFPSKCPKALSVI